MTQGQGRLGGGGKGSGTKSIRERALPAEGTACAKALGCKSTGHGQGTMQRGVCLGAERRA